MALVQRLGDKRSLQSGEDKHPHSGGRNSKTGWKALSRNCRLHQIAKTHGVYGRHQTEGQAKINGSGSPAWQPTPMFLPGELHGQRSLAGYSPWDHKELDTTERPTLPLSAHLRSLYDEL